jgi:hypothetical protein
VASEHGLELCEEESGAPENKGTDFTASQYLDSDSNWGGKKLI